MAAISEPSDLGWRDPNVDQPVVQETPSIMRPFKLHERIIKERERENPPPVAPVIDGPMINQPPSRLEDPESSDTSDAEASNEMNEEFKGDEDDEKEDDEDFIASLPANRHPKKRPRNPQQIGIDGAARDASKKSRRKVCEFCGAQDTPMWRRGPQGKGTLCNACGVKWSLKFRKRVPKKSRENNGVPPVNDRMTPTYTNTGSRPRDHVVPTNGAGVASSTVPTSPVEEDPVADFTKPREDVWKKRYENGNWKKERNLTEPESPDTKKTFEKFPNISAEISPDDSQKKYPAEWDTSDDDVDIASASASGNARRIRLEFERNEKYTWEDISDEKGHSEFPSKFDKARKAKSFVKKEGMNSPDSTSASPTGPGNPLFSHLLKAVRDRVVEEDELQTLRDEISNFQDYIKQQEIEKGNLVENSRKNLETKIRGLWADMQDEISGKTAQLAIECFKDVHDKLGRMRPHINPETHGEMEDVIFKLNTFMDQFQQLANMTKQDMSHNLTFEDSKLGAEMDGLVLELGNHYKEVNEQLRQVQDALNKQ